jgi:hypothetical protein
VFLLREADAAGTTRAGGSRRLGVLALPAQVGGTGWQRARGSVLEATREGGRLRESITLKSMAEGGYVMGLPTIGEVATHMELHYDVYFSIEDFANEMAEFEKLIEGHEDDSIFKYLTEEDKVRLDDELEKTMNENIAEENDKDGVI